MHTSYLEKSLVTFEFLSSKKDVIYKIYTDDRSTNLNSKTSLVTTLVRLGKSDFWEYFYFNLTHFSYFAVLKVTEKDISKIVFLMHGCAWIAYILVVFLTSIGY